MKAKRSTGYSDEVAKFYISDKTKVLLLSTELQKQVKWVDHKPTDEITGYKVLCGMPNDYFTVKFDHKVQLPPFGSSVKFKELEACEIDNKVWFRAQDIEEA